jgi:hypothetical protein
MRETPFQFAQKPLPLGIPRQCCHANTKSKHQTPILSQRGVVWQSMHMDEGHPQAIDA